jgi:hypothetical protein
MVLCALPAGLSDQHAGFVGAQDTTRSLYNRNVSSSTLLSDKDDTELLPEPQRHEGDIIRFDRCFECAQQCSHVCQEALARWSAILQSL